MEETSIWLNDRIHGKSYKTFRKSGALVQTSDIMGL